MRKVAVLFGVLALYGVLASISLARDSEIGREATASLRSDCINVNTEKITGTEITTSPGLGCPGTRRVMKQYFRLVVDTGQTLGGCAQVRATKGCQVGKFRCYTIYRYSTGDLRGVCKGARGRVRFREIDRGPN